MIKIHNQYMNWQTASPIILAALVFHKPLPCDSVKAVMEANMPKAALGQKAADMAESKKAASGGGGGGGSGWGKNLFGWGGKSKSAEPAALATSVEQKQTVATTATNTVTHRDGECVLESGLI